MTSSRTRAAAKRAAQIVRLSRKGLSIAAIAAEVGCERATVGRARAKAKFKASRKVPRAATDDQIRACVARGMIDKVGAAELGMSASHYAHRRRALGLSPNGQSGRRPAVSDGTVRDCHKKGLTDAQAAKLTGYSVAGFGHRRRQLGLAANIVRKSARNPIGEAAGKSESGAEGLAEEAVRGAFQFGPEKVAILRLLEPLVAREMGRCA